MQSPSASGRLSPSNATLLAAVLFLSILTGCSTPARERPDTLLIDQPSVPADAISLADHGYTTWFNTARTLVEQQLDVDLTDVELKVVDSHVISDYAQDGLLRALKHDIDNDVFAKALVRNILTSESSGSVLAIYSPQVKAILLHRDNLMDYLSSVAGYTSDREALQALLLHELVHAADDKKHNAFDQTNATYQEVFSKSTILEGHAQWQARRLCELANCTAAFEHMNTYMFSLSTMDDPALNYIQTRNFRNLQFVYREGERFVDHIMQQPAGESLLRQAITQPPRDSLQIIDPASFPNRNRENRNLQISNTIKQSRKPWPEEAKGLLTRNIVAAAAFTAQPDTRNPIIEFYSERVVAAAKHEYYDRNSDIPIPVAITVMQTDNDTTASDTATLIFESTADTYQNLNGQLVELSHWKRDHHRAAVNDSLLGNVIVTMNTAGGRMNNHMVGSKYPFEVVTASSGDFIVHIDGRFEGTEALMQYAGRLLIELRRRSLRQL